MDPKLVEILMSVYGLSKDEAIKFAGGLAESERIDPMRQAMKDLISSTARYHAATGAAGTDPNQNPYDRMVQQYSGGAAIPATPASGEVPNFSTLNIHDPYNNPLITARNLSDEASTLTSLAQTTNSPGGDSYWQGQLDRKTHPFYTSQDKHSDIRMRQWRRGLVIDAKDKVNAASDAALSALAEKKY